jgi:hypothetical protein
LLNETKKIFNEGMAEVRRKGSLLGPSDLTPPFLWTPKYISIWDQVGAKKSLQVGEVGPQTFLGLGQVKSPHMKKLMQATWEDSLHANPVSFPLPVWSN